MAPLENVLARQPLSDVDRKAFTAGLMEDKTLKTGVTPPFMGAGHSFRNLSIHFLQSKIY